MLFLVVGKFPLHYDLKNLITLIHLTNNFAINNFKIYNKITNYFQLDNV